MVTVGMNYQIIPGKEQIFEDAFSNVIGVMEAGEGHGQTHLYKQVKDDSSYLIVSEWTDENAFNSFIKSDAFAKVTNWGKENILAGRPSHKVYPS